MEELTPFTEEQEESSIDIKAEIFKYLKYWRWMFIGFVIGGLLAYLYNRYTIPKYRTEATMQIVDEGKDGALNLLSSERGGLFSMTSASMENQIETLKSKSLIESVVAELKHNISYHLEGNVIAVEAYEKKPFKIKFISPDSIVAVSSSNFFITPISNTKFNLKDGEEISENYHFGDIINYKGLKFIVNPVSEKDYNSFPKNSTVNVILKPLIAVANEYISNLEISRKGKASNILILSLIQESSKKSEDFLNTLVGRFDEEKVKDKQEVAENTTLFIQERLKIITSELDSVEGNIAEFKRENSFMDIQSGASLFKNRANSAEGRSFGLETQLSLITSVEELLLNRKEFELLPADIGINEGGINNLIDTYNSLVIERNNYLRNSTPKNPIIVKIDEKLKTLRGGLLDNIKSTRRAINVELNELNQRETMSEYKFSNFPGLERGIRGIERQQQIKEQLYLFLLRRREEAAISFAATASAARLVDPAYTINEPVDPKPWLILLSGFVIGLITPILIIFVKNLMDTKIHHKGDLNSLLKHIPFIGEVPRIGTDENDIIHLNDRSSLAESFRILRTNLAYLIQNRDKNVGSVIFVTSTVKGEGKTFISYNLSRTLGSTNKSILLIGADIRNPKLHRYTDRTEGAKEKGLSDYLYDYDVTALDIISKTNEDNISVDVILSGPIPPNPAELLMNNRMEELINQAKSQYDYVIVDTAPAMIVTDTLLISQLADYTLYVTRADFTEKNLLEFPKDLKKQGKLKGLAVILNDVDYSKFSYGAQYGYSYGYGYGYGVDKESRWQRIKKRLFS